MSDLNPPTDDVLQEEAAPVKMTPVPVVVEGPARIQQLPTRSAGWRTYDLVPDAGQKVLEADPRRRRAVLQASGDSIMLGGSQAGSRAGAQFTDGVLIEITSCDEVWARTVSVPAVACTLAVMNEQWAD